MSSEGEGTVYDRIEKLEDEIATLRNEIDVIKNAWEEQDEESRLIDHKEKILKYLSSYIDKNNLGIKTGAGFLNHSNIDISNDQIAKAFPSRATLASMEPKVAADCFLSVCQEMKDDKATHLGLTCDHGHRKDQDHFVKLISWAGMDEEGNANHGGKGGNGKVSLPALWKKRQAAVRRAEELGLSEVELLRERLNDTEKRLNTIRSPLMDELQLLKVE